MRVIRLFTILLCVLSPVTGTSQERVLTHESSAGSYSASIKSGHIESRGAMRVEGIYRDIFDTKNWGATYQHIWRVYIATPLKFIWNDDTADPGKVELIVYEMSLSQDEKLSALVVNVNNQGQRVFEPAVPMRRTVLDITREVKRGENVIEISSKTGTDLLHGVQSVAVVYQRTTRSKTQQQAIFSGLAGAKFYALIIAVQTYVDPKVNSLDFPWQDATRLREILSKAYSFDSRNITLLKDPDRSTIIEELDRLTQQITPDDSLLIFYAGHGYWDENLKQGFWLPSNARKDSRAQWLSNSTLRDYLGGIRARHVLLIADACFSGSIFKTRDAFNDENASVQELYRLPSRKALTSGAMKTVPDRSVFVEYLVKRLNENQQNYLSAEELFSSMRKAVINNSPNRQTPQYGEIREAGDEGGDFVFCAEIASVSEDNSSLVAIDGFNRCYRKNLKRLLNVMGDEMAVRTADKVELDHLAKVWFDSWQDAHAQILPVELARLRTLESFRDRLQAALPDVRVVGPICAPVGFCIIKGDELYQLFVSAQSRGSGVAAALLADAEARLSATGVETAWLACAIGNERAARFYEKCGWHRTGTMINVLETTNGPFPLEVWRYEKLLARPVGKAFIPY